MKEFRFKIMEEGDSLYSFTETLMIIKKKSGEYHIYKVTGFNDGSPKFDKDFKLVIKKGVGKIEAYDTESEITVMI
jgi:hypothetical protein